MYKLYPEWNAQSSVLIAWPHRPDLWYGHFPEIESLWARIVALLSQNKGEVWILNDPSLSPPLCPSPLPLSSPSSLGDKKILDILVKHEIQEGKIRFLPICTDDVWIRDYGPIWTDESKAILFHFDGWGKKYTPWERDDLAGRKILDFLHHEAITEEIVLEGGAVDTDGFLLLTTRSCLLKRNIAKTCKDYEKLFYRYFGIQEVIWLEEGLPDDDTDGHVDLISRFIGRRKILTSVCEKENEPADESLRRNLTQLEKFRDQHGQPLEIETIPLPPPLYHSYEDRLLPRSYANFFIANQMLLVPVFREKTDEKALRILQNCFPDKEIYEIPADKMILEGGGIHCMTMQKTEFANSNLNPLDKAKMSM